MPTLRLGPLVYTFTFRTLHQYLHGNKCTIYTDHECLKYIYVLPHLNACQACKLECLAELDLSIVYKPGVENVATDVLSHFG